MHPAYAVEVMHRGGVFENDGQVQPDAKRQYYLTRWMTRRRTSMKLHSKAAVI